MWLAASFGATWAHIVLFCGKPCSSRRGGPDPPMTQDISASPTSTVRCEKPSNIAFLLPGQHALQEFGGFDDGAVMATFADESGFVGASNVEAQASSLDGDQLDG